MIDHRSSTEEIEAANSRAEALLEDYLWAAAHVQHYDYCIAHVNVPKPEGPVSIAEWVAHQQRIDAAREMDAAFWRLKEPYRQAKENAYWGLCELLPKGQPFIIVAFCGYYEVEARSNHVIVKAMEDYREA